VKKSILSALKYGRNEPTENQVHNQKTD